jgi:hypothetical protein
MSKTKLAVLVFAVAFGVNFLAFFFSKKAMVVEEAKSVWIYELPLSASPLDAYVALDLSPQQGVIGTLFQPDHLSGERPLTPLLAESWSWNAKENTLELKLKAGLRYSNGDPIEPAHFVAAHEFVRSKSPDLSSVPVWNAFLGTRFEATEGGLRIRIPAGLTDFDLEDFLTEVLTHPLSGVIHPLNLDALKRGEKPAKEWISSGPYKIRKWLPKEIILVSRDDFPVMLPKPFFRTLKFQSAPIKNPSCDFILARPGESESLNEHRVQETEMQLSVFWVCRSFREDAFCKDAAERSKLAALLSGRVPPSPELLAGKQIRYRIPLGSDEFRTQIRERITSVLGGAGARVEETSFFFKNSDQTDLELQFVVTPVSQTSERFAAGLASLSSRLAEGASREKDLMGLWGTYSLQVLMKHQRGGIFPKVFIEADLDEKKLPF